MTNEELFDAERELEDYSKQLGIDAYRKHLAEGREAELPPGIRLIQEAIIKLSPKIEELRTTRARGRTTGAALWLRTCPLSSDEVAYIIAKTCVNSVSTETFVQEMCKEIMGHVLDAVEYRKFEKQAYPVLVMAEQKLKESGTKNTKHRRVTIMRHKRLVGIDDESLPAELKFQIGHTFLDLFIEHVGVVQKLTYNKTTKKARVSVIVPTPELLEWLEAAHAQCELLRPRFMPMVCPPRPWVSVFDGGYYTFRVPLVRVHRKITLDTYENSGMDKVLRAVNTVQDTKWRINRRVLEVIQELQRAGQTLGVLPEPALEPCLPGRPWSNDAEFQEIKRSSPEVIKAWRKKSSSAYNMFYRNTSKRITLLQQIAIADKLKDYETIYFPHNVDFRGRLYPIPRFLHPQGDDTARSLLEFSESEPLGAEGSKWLAIHLANCFGNDKVSFQERIAWTFEHSELICDSAKEPLDGARLWVDADKPFLFLAACFEWAEFISKGTSALSNIPIQMDGTCNGLQHLSAMLNDERGAAAVNLEPLDKPADIYTEVAEVARGMTEEIIATAEDDNTRALAWFWKERLARWATKRNTMTLPYGVTKYGMVQQLYAEMQDRVEKEGHDWLNGLEQPKLCQFLGNVNWEATSKVVKASRSLMDWLKKCAGVVAKHSDTIWWTTPSGFTALQAYHKYHTKRVYTFCGSVRVAYTLAKPAEKVDRSKQVTGISPNFIHSFDAAHLVNTVGTLEESGITSFSMIHDSYGVHARHVALMRRVLREEFVMIYREDALARFLEELKTQVPPEVHNEFPELPAKGTFDINRVLASEYFFG